MDLELIQRCYYYMMAGQHTIQEGHISLAQPKKAKIPENCIRPKNPEKQAELDFAA